MLLFVSFQTSKAIPLFYWQPPGWVNFGDYISLVLVERIVGHHIETSLGLQPPKHQQRLFAVGSILAKAADGDIIWGSGVSGKRLKKEDYHVKTHLDIRAVRGPLTRQFLIHTFNIPCPEVYGDPALLFPFFFPEFKKSKKPKYEYIIIPHYTEQKLFPKKLYKNVVYPTEPWELVIKKILDSKFVISSSLHGLIVAEAYKIPARLLRITNNEPLFKYQDYYLGTRRPHFKYATSIEEALKMGGEPAFSCDLKKLYTAFPFDCWPNKEISKMSHSLNP